MSVLVALLCSISRCQDTLTHNPLTMSNFFCIDNQLSPLNVSSSHQALYLVEIITMILQRGFRFVLEKEGGVIAYIVNRHFLFGKRALDFSNAIRFAFSRVIQQTIWTSTKPRNLTIYNEAT